MANTTDKSILTAAGKALLAQLNAEEKPLIIDKMMFANVPNRPEFPQPDDVVPTDDIVHQEQVEQRGRLSADSVIYSTTLTSDVGPFEFNWTGAYCSEYGVLVTIDHHALTPKTADEPGVAGNTLVRSVVLEYKDIAEITNITVDASSWQYNATDRMKKMDSDVAQSIIDQNGKDWFIEDGFLVTPSGEAYNIKAGAGYVSGNRVSMEFDRSVQVPNKPSFIYIDAHREGTPTGEQVTLFDFVITAEEKDDYIDSSTGKDIPHFVCKIAEVLADGSVSDLRPESWVKENFVDKTGSKKGLTVRAKPSNEKQTEWYRPGLFDVSSFGEVGGDAENEIIADDAFRDTREEMLAAGGGKMFMPSTRYTVKTPVIPDQSDTAGKFVIEGESQNTARIETDQDIDVIVSRERLTLNRVKLVNTHANKIGRGVATNNTKQSSVSSHRDSIIEGFRFGVWHRYSLWNEFRNLNFIDNVCGIRLSRHAYQADNSNPLPTKGWNSWEDGWFHNAIVMDQVYCEGGEVGIWAAMMCGTLIGCTTQGQRADGVTNDVLPDGLHGTGVLLDCGSDTTRSGWNNTIISHYCEFSDVGLHAIGQKYVGIDGFFMQGGDASNRAKSMLIAENSLIMARGVVGQDYWEDGLFKALNNGTIVLEGGHSGPKIGAEFNVDATSEVLPRGQCDLDKKVFRISKPLGVAEMTWTLTTVVPDYSVMKLYFVGQYDGYQERAGECTIYNLQSTSETIIQWPAKSVFNSETSLWEVKPGNIIGVDVTASNSGTVQIKLSGNQAYYFRVIAQVVGGENVSNTSIGLIGV
ncbi:phage tail protein [Vibrio sp. EA2]|uniref:phage tail-collar fiber domain-containing protein n=1 Tax=Vibrio sp. EA2 TaxID=3079860 RepID=UPI00294A42B6|nr:phage tail protein [Vibrio sp. EA2]MDV6252127.1 phage tail protein [Vibrio sp. EA2]